MGIGKVGAQCAHAARYLQVDYNKLDLKINRYYKCEDNTVPLPEDLLRCSDYKDWMKKGTTTVILKADDKEWEKLKEEFKTEMVLITDAGKTEIPSGSETCIGLWPRPKSKFPKIVSRLQALK